MNISKRGHQATQTELRSDFKLFFEAKENQWDAQSNPDGKFPLNMAENNLCWDLLKNKIEDILRNQAIPKWTSNYTGIVGHDTFLESLSRFLETHLINEPVDPTCLATSAGATAMIEVCSWVLCDENDVAAFPAPSYPVYTQDINNKAGVKRYDIVTHNDVDEIREGSLLSIAHLYKAKKDIEQKGENFKLLVLTNPDNPTGCTYPKSLLIEIANWCTDNKVHLLVNELYGLSIIDGTHNDIKEDYKQKTKFESFGKVIHALKSDYLHLAYGLSKDFGISGFRVGLVYSLNEAFIEGYKNMNAPHMVSNITQWIVQEFLNDSEFIESYIKENQKRLTENYAVVVKSLKENKVPYAIAQGSLFVWLELSHFLSANTEEEEHKLWMSIYNETGILLTPGQGFGHTKRGQFRLVYSYLEKPALEEVMRRLSNYIQQKNSIG